MSYDVFGHGNTMVRGGWGVYRYVTQVNTVANGEAQGTAADVLGYGQPGSTELQMQNIQNQAFVPCPSFTRAPPCGVQGGQTGLDPSDYGQPMTQAYNFTIDQRLPWNSQLEVAYVGSTTSQLVDGGEDISGSSYTELTNQNKTADGRLVRGRSEDRQSLPPTRENVTENPNLIERSPKLRRATRLRITIRWAWRTAPTQRTSCRTPHMPTTTAFRCHGSRPPDG